MYEVKILPQIIGKPLDVNVKVKDNKGQWVDCGTAKKPKGYSKWIKVKCPKPVSTNLIKISKNSFTGNSMDICGV